jgi:hypothetical protein
MAVAFAGEDGTGEKILRKLCEAVQIMVRMNSH